MRELVPKGTKPCPPKGGVYALVDPGTSKIMRIGRSKELDRREREHANNPLFEDYTFTPLYRTDKYNEQRGLEQKAYNQYKPPSNYIIPISPGNPNYMNYMNSATAYIQSLQ
jgi:hypothetical protein